MKITPFFCDRLMRLLKRTCESKVSILVAPTGYGKTTAVKELEAVSDLPFYWFSARWEDVKGDFANLCQFVKQFDADAAARLEEISNTSLTRLHEVASVIKDVKSQSGEDIVVVLDDIHMLTERTSPIILDALLMHDNPKVHILLLGHPFSLPVLRFDPYAVHWIGVGELALKQKDLIAFYRLNGFDMSEAEADEMYEQTLGWPAAVSSCLDRKKAGKAPDHVLVTQRLLNQVCVERIHFPLRRLLMGLSLFETGTRADIAALVPDTTMQTVLDEELLKVPLLLADPATLSYHMHDTLRQLLQTRLQNNPEEIKREIYLTCGRRLANQDRQIEAITCFYKIKDYDGILSLNLRLLNFALIGQKPFEEIAREIVEECPDEVLQRHPIGLLRLAYILYGAGDLPGYYRALSRAAAFMTKENEPELYGEWLIISMLQHIPDLPRMHALVKEAATYIKGPARAIAQEEPFLFGSPSIWYLFYQTPGQGDEVAEQLESWLMDYERLFIRRGSGAALLYRGELASMRCQFELSDALANTAMSQGEDAQQPSIVYGCVMLLARNAIARRDEDGIRKALHYLDTNSAISPKFAGTPLDKAIYQTVQVMILSMLRELGLEKELYREGLAAPRNESVLMRMTVHVRVLEYFYKGEIELAIGQMEALLQKSERLYNIVTVYTVALALGIFYWHSGRQKEALAYARLSLEIGREDDLYTLYVNHWDLAKELLQHDRLADFSVFISRVEEISKKLQRRGGMKIVDELDTLPDTLTDREREVAMLAGQGFTNPEIAKKLFVTESTVKKHMLTIFRKLSIDRRAKLISLLNPD